MIIITIIKLIKNNKKLGKFQAGGVLGEVQKYPSAPIHGFPVNQKVDPGRAGFGLRGVKGPLVAL